MNTLQDALWSGVAALGFAVLFNVPPSLLLRCAAIGAFGHAARTLLMQLGIPLEAATFASAFGVGLIALYFSDRYRVPATIFSIVGAIPMVPGVFAYRAMLGLVSVATSGDSALVSEALTLVVKTSFILIAIAFGIVLPRLLFRRAKPVV
jgi:uncharacterized membrane protein YjjB (DUF3815 family)